MRVSQTVSLGRAVVGAGGGTDTDRELLRRFARDGDQTAFEALVRRHAGMVLGVCRRSLPTVQDAEDACQATFVVLARRAAAVRWSESVASWLYTTARLVARNARVAAARRVEREARAAVPEVVEPVDRVTGREMLAALDAAIDRLPPAYREPLVLCYLEGLTHDEAAARLGVPRGTVGTRVDRGRKRLHAALVRAGLAPTAGLLALAVANPASARLVGLALAAVAGPVPVAVAELANGIATTGTAKSLVCALVALACACALAAGLASVAPSRGGVARPTAAKGEPPVVAPSAARVEIKGRVVDANDKPLPGAKLFLHLGHTIVPAQQVAAGDDGRFLFTISGDTLPLLLATAPGQGVGRWPLNGRPVAEFTLRLTPDEPVRGRVVDPEGKPVAGVSVSARALYMYHGEKDFDRWLKAARDPDCKEVARGGEPIYGTERGFTGPIEPATSDRDGRFELRGIGRDRVVVLRASSPTTATHELTVVTRKVERFTARADTAITGSAEEVHGCEPVVVAAPVPVTTGRVLDDATGEPVPGTVLRVGGLHGSSRLAELIAVAGRDGTFVLPGLPPGGRPHAFVLPPGDTLYHALKVSVPDEPAGRAGFDIKLTRGVPVTVKVVDKVTRAPVESQLRYGVFPGDNPNQKAVPNVRHFHQTEHPRRPYISYESEFRIVAFPGKGMLAVQVPEVGAFGGAYLCGVGAGTFEKHRRGDELVGTTGVSRTSVRDWHTFAEIDVPADAKSFAVTLELDRGLTAPVRLIDADGRPVAGAESYGLVHPAGGARWSRPLADATPTAVALRAGEQRRVMFVHTDRKLAGSAVVVGGAKDPVEVRMVPWGEVKGRIVNADGKPVDVRLDLSTDFVRKPDLKFGSTPIWNPAIAGVYTGEDGCFRITGLVPGLTYRWGVNGWTVDAATSTDTVAKGGETIDLGEIVVRPEQP